ncbi:MAG TPA: AMP-binding protein [Anaerolineae bacterium]|nr:AMP-binding protein [Anaerolineae bacterium]
MRAEAFYDTNIHALLATQAEAFDDRPYLRQADQTWTYAETFALVERLSAGLQELDLKPGERFAVVLPNLAEFVFTYFAAARLGLIVVPINVRRTKEEVIGLLAKTKPKAMLTFSDPVAYRGMDHLSMALEARSNLPDLQHVIALGIEHPDCLAWDQLAASPGTPPPARCKHEDPFLILHNLGNSKKPRGAVLVHHALVRNAADIAARLRCTPEDVFLGSPPFSNTFGFTPTILSCTVSGASLAVLPRYEPKAALDLIESAAITVHHGVPTMFALELHHPEFRTERCASLRTGIMSGAFCPPKLVERVRNEMGFNLILAYGLTEASPSVTMTRLDDGPITATQTVGTPMEDVEIKVIDTQGKTLPGDEEGELCVRGYNVMQGYWEDEQSTAQVLDSEGWLRTGDLAVITADGPVRILGRIGETIKRGGFGIHPRSVEMVLRSHPKVRDAAVVGIPDMIYGQITCACIVRKPDVHMEAKELLEFAGERLADYAVPDRLLFFESLPRVGSGAVRKDVLRDLARRRGLAWKFGKNIDTDSIIPARRCNTADANELAKYCMEDADPEFVHKMQRGDLIVAETNFGCGSSREVAPLCIKAAGISAVIAKSFARIFFRNAINIGLPILECPQAVDGIEAGDEIEIEAASGTIHNLTRGTSFQATPYPEFLQRIIEHGGLLHYVEQRLKEGNP